MTSSVPPKAVRRLRQTLSRLTKPYRRRYEEELVRLTLHQAQRFIRERGARQAARDFLAQAYGQNLAAESCALIRRMTTEPDLPPRHRDFPVRLRADADALAREDAQRQVGLLQRHFLDKVEEKLWLMVTDDVRYSIRLLTCSLNGPCYRAALRFEFENRVAFTVRLQMVLRVRGGALRWQYRLTFHDVVLPSGRQSWRRSHAQVLSLFGV